MLSANINKRGGIRKRLYVHKIEKRGGFSRVKCILISILSESPFLIKFILGAAECSF